MNFIYDRIRIALQQLEARATLATAKIEGFRYCECGYKTSNTPPDDGAFSPLPENFSMQDGKEHHLWLAAEAILPTDFIGGSVELVNRSDATHGWSSQSPQIMTFSDGKLLASFDHCHTAIPIDSAREKLTLYFYIYLSPVAKLYSVDFALRLVDEEALALYYDMVVPHRILEYLEPDTKTYCEIANSLNDAVNLLDMRDRGELWHRSVLTARSYLKTEFYEKRCGGDGISCTCIGHTHIDVAWLWTFAQTREKAQRSFATFVALLKKYPEFKCMSSQPQLYAFVKEDAPALYEEIKALVRAGRWEAEGAMWVEADCNLTSGESLIRQILYGKRFFREEFGVDSRVLWLPDVFGYSAALPQILKKCGVDYFITSKISWNETNRMPYDIFRWQGIDGTTVLSYFLTAQNKKRGVLPSTGTIYNATTEPRMIAGAWDRFAQKDIASEVLVPYGYGDGGGGPTMDHIEYARRMAYGIPGCPTVKQGFTADFMDRMEKTVGEDPHLPKWVGELYLEYHRGTYTSQAKNKKNNRRSEFLYQNAETASLMANRLVGFSYPQKELSDGWKKILLCQFHDVLPGSSIREVYEDSGRIYDEVLGDGERILADARGTIAESLQTDGGLLVFNPNAFAASSTVIVEGKSAFVSDIPAKGYAVVKPDMTKPISVSEETRTLESDDLRAVFDENMNLISLYDKRANRETIQEGTHANALIAYEDYPKAYDAWEITEYYTEKSWKIDGVTEWHEIPCDGARVGFYVRRDFGESVIEQKIYLYSNEKRLDFETTIDWKCDHILLKSAFPFALNTDTATFDIQYGNVRRPTHRNTSWDAAKFEVCMHKFADLSEHRFGVSLLTDCKYGVDAKDSTLSLTLLKSATYPDPTADKCHHEFTYSIYPHEGDFRDAGTIRHAYLLNNPLAAMALGHREGKLPERYSLVSVDGENIVIETVKGAEDGDGIVVRLCDEFNESSVRTLTFGFNISGAYLCDMLENERAPLAVNGRSVTVAVKPFEIVTVKVK